MKKKEKKELKPSFGKCGREVRIIRRMIKDPTCAKSRNKGNANQLEQGASQ